MSQKNINKSPASFISILFSGRVLKIGLVLLLIFFGFRIVKARFNSSPETDQISVEKAIKETEVNREFKFPLLDSKGEEVSQIVFVVDKAEVRNQLIVKGKKATSVEGRTFLVLNLKISNEYSKTIKVDTRDYVRLSVNGNENEWLAPDIHNDPVEVQSISTKYTRLAFPINDTDEKFILQIGEVNGNKEKVSLEL